MVKYEPNWESLKSYTVPEWFKDAKLGIFIHWGVYAVPAFDNEWYPRFMYRNETSRKGPNYFQHHRQRYGPQSEFGYKDFIPMFKAEKWDPETWIELFQAAGARYVVPVAEHHDGFPMYATDLTPWNAANMGPKRDVVAELARATRKAGLKFGVSSHRAFNWRYYTYGEGLDTIDPANAGLYSPAHAEDEPASQAFLEDWFARTRELVDRFQPDVLWFDFGWHFDEFAPYRPQVAAYYYNHAQQWGGEAVLQYKDKFPDGVAVLDIERGKLDDIRKEYWQTDTSVSYKSWSYIEDDHFRSVTSLVHDLVDIVSKNGNLLLNVGPRADGVIPDEPAGLLRGLGKWLAVNGEAIYGTRPWRVYGEGPTEVSTERFKEHEYKAFTAQDIRFTTATCGGGETLYAICMGCPEGAVTIESLSTDPVASVSLLGSDASLSWSQGDGGLTIQMPAEAPCEHAVTFEVQLKN